MTDATTAASNRRILISLRRLAVEMLVGFVGVYAAFALSAYKDRRDQTERRHQIKRALIVEVKQIAALSRANAGGWGPLAAKFDSSAAAGHPRSYAFIEPVNVNAHVWEATKQAGGLNLIDVPTFVMLADFYNRQSQMYAQYNELRDFYASEIMPRLSKRPESFYLPGTRTLLPQFGIYHYALKRLGGMDSTISRLGDTLLVRLAKDTI